MSPELFLEYVYDNDILICSGDSCIVFDHLLVNIALYLISTSDDMSLLDILALLTDNNYVFKCKDIVNALEYGLNNLLVLYDKLVDDYGLSLYMSLFEFLNEFIDLAYKNSDFRVYSIIQGHPSLSLC